MVEERIANFGIFLDVFQFFASSVLLYASVERCFVSRMRDFCVLEVTKLTLTLFYEGFDFFRFFLFFCISAIVD